MRGRKQIKVRTFTQDTLPERATVKELAKITELIAPPGIQISMIYKHIQRSNLKVDKQHKINVQEFLQGYIKAKAEDNKNVATQEITQNPKRYKDYLQCLQLQMEIERGKKSNDIDDAFTNWEYEHAEDDDISFDDRIKLLTKMALNTTIATAARIQAIKTITELKGDGNVEVNPNQQIKIIFEVEDKRIKISDGTQTGTAATDQKI